MTSYSSSYFWIYIETKVAIIYYHIYLHYMKSAIILSSFLSRFLTSNAYALFNNKKINKIEKNTHASINLHAFISQHVCMHQPTCNACIKQPACINQYACMHQATYRHAHASMHASVKMHVSVNVHT